MLSTSAVAVCCSSAPRVFGTERELRVRLEVLYRDRPCFEEDTGGHGGPVVRVAQVARDGHRSAMRRQPQSIAVGKYDEGVLGGAEPQRVLDDRIKNGLNVGR